MERTVNYGDIGWAVNHMRHGHKMRRRGWNGRDMWVTYVPAGSVQVPQKFGEGHNVKQFLVMRTTDGDLVPWLASQTDILETDWELVNATQPGVYSATQQTSGAPGPNPEAQAQSQNT